MRPLRLRVEGFGAYLEPQEILFDEVELFAITGPTGSGKSTLLDAITYALYKQTPRIGAKGFSELRHPGAAHTRVELEFGVAEQVWRVVRVLGKDNQHRLEYLQDGTWRVHLSSEKAKTLDAQIAHLLGMDYDTFTRAILLPQGQFDLFLRGAAKDRRETLIKLYGLERLKAMRERVGEHLREARERLKLLEGELLALEEAEEGRLEALREEIEKLRREEGSLEAQVAQAERDLKRREELAQKFEEWERMQRTLKRLEVEATDLAQFKLRLERAQAAERVLPQVEAFEAAQREAHQARTHADRARSEAERLQAELSRLEAGYDLAALEAAKAELARLPLLEAWEKSLMRHGGNLNLRHPAPLSFDEDRLKAIGEAERAWGEVEKLEGRLAQLEGELAQEQARLRRRQAERDGLERELERLKALGQEAAKVHEAAKAAFEAAQQKAGVLLHRHLLRAGEPCPLCAQPVAALPPEAPLPDLEGLRLELARTDQQLQELRGAYQEKRGSLKALSESLPEEAQRLAARQQERDKLAGEVQQLKAGLFGSPESLAEERVRMLAGLAAQLRAATGGEAVGRFKAALQKKASDLEATRSRLEEAEQRLAEAQRKHLAAEEAAKAAESGLARLEQSLSISLRNAGFTGPDEVRKAQLSPAERDSLTQRIESHQKDKEYATKRLEVLTAELIGQPLVGPEAVREAKGRLDELRARAKEVHGRRVGLEGDLDRLEGQLKRKREIQGEQAKLSQSVDLWERLARDLQGDRFQDYLLERYQTGLLQRATELMGELSGGRYRFCLDGGEYAVEDRWIHAVRPVRTLSGGESFLASLSLALSLSEHLSRGRIGALFLDEGFGTLDAETLEQVAGVLEALPTRGRLVGIVTHVEALAERLPARLVVDKHPSGSRLRWLER
ncbi:MULTISPECIES: AAA family ATPase [unclassified Meiothermus]|uniref:AAA family ATPase n=1 Tax=unclassified Meiothermus TaxID=370471 RepID=UPI000D7CFA74|nr:MULTISPECIES: SMC family ATPase [unclassified Meiothermus]PZA07986.1 SMC family ATPase [Meiothermus sp. Pnk-1]RYM35329.1 SMC family ATPase [Meiothermus sp. PNK-Is4]